jgi:hypothetical protein
MPLNTTAVFGLQHMSKCLEKKDTQSIQKWLRTVGASMPDTTTERTFMEQKKKYVPYEMKGRITKNQYKKKDTEPDMNGEMMYKGEIIKFGVWENESQYGIYYGIKISDPNWNKQTQQSYPKDVTPNSNIDDGEIPF